MTIRPHLLDRRPKFEHLEPRELLALTVSLEPVTAGDLVDLSAQPYQPGDRLTFELVVVVNL